MRQFVYLKSLQQHYLIKPVSLPNKVELTFWLPKLKEVVETQSDEAKPVNFLLEKIGKLADLEFTLNRITLTIEEVNEVIDAITKVNFHPSKGDVKEETDDGEKSSKKPPSEPVSLEEFLRISTIRLIHWGLVPDLHQARSLVRQLSAPELADFLEQQYLWLTRDEREKQEEKAQQEKEAEEFADELRAGKMFGVGAEDIDKLRDGFLRSMRRPKSEPKPTELDSKPIPDIKPNSSDSQSENTRASQATYDRNAILEQIRKDFPDEDID